MIRKQIRDLVLTTELMYDYRESTDRFLLIQDYLDNRIDDMPTLTDSPCFVEWAVDIVAKRLAHANDYQTTVDYNKVHIGWTAALNAAIARRDYFLGL
jgi:hypothetical protein